MCQLSDSSRSKIVLLAAVAIVCVSAANKNAHNDAPSRNTLADDELSKQRIFLAPKAAKSFLRVRRGWGFIKKITGEEEEEEEEEGREHRHRQYIARTCPTQCMGSWSSWSSCTSACGNSGTKRRSRAVRPPTQCAGWVRQHGCPGARQQTVACNRHCYNGGTLRGSGCGCRTGYTGSCCQTRITCGYPGKPSNGEVSPAGHRHVSGTTVRFSCHVGYRISGPSTRQCQLSGRWNNAVPTCRIISCGDPGVPAHGRRQGTSFVFGRSVVYSCVEGYVLQGSNTLRCEARGHWSPARPTCTAVRCPSMPSPTSGWVRFSNGTYFRSVAQFGCSTGYYLEGPSRRTCQLNANWDGTQVSCKRITCNKLGQPSNGFVSYKNANLIVHGDKATFSCKTGYVIRGPQTRTCTGSSRVGTWSGDVTSCQAVSCGDPGTPSHGTKLGSAYTFPYSVDFKCLPGYFMEGQDKTNCQSNGRWTTRKPECKACPRNTYQISSNTNTQCMECPAHSHTVSAASTMATQCVCDTGFSGPPGGPCGQVRCTPLRAVTHGTLSACQNTVGDKCVFSCQSGYIRASGTRDRQCRADGTWSGVSPTCIACPVNTYRATETRCDSCPANSHTATPGSTLRRCVCNNGYRGPPGGPCTDMDECAASNGGGCEQACVNNQGSFTCTCNIPGFVVDSRNTKRCKASRSCDPLTAPSNGGLVCGKEVSTNTERCEVKCNAGFEHIDRTNAFEECGPSSDWMWTSEVNGTPLLPCVEQFYPGIQVESEVAYFVTSCSSLSEAQKSSLRQQFIQMLRNQGICRDVNQSSCKIEDVAISCGAEGDSYFGARRKRSTSTSISKLKITFKIKVPKESLRHNQCAQLCAANAKQCIASCAAQFKSKATSTVVLAKDKLKRIFNQTATNTRRFSHRVPTTAHRDRFLTTIGSRGNRRISTYHRRPSLPSIFRGHRRLAILPVRPSLPRSVLTLSIGGISLFPIGATTASRVSVQCDAGMENKDGICVACPPGSYLPSVNAMCVPCSPGTYQPRSQQTRCLPCSASRNRSKTGSQTCS